MAGLVQQSYAEALFMLAQQENQIEDFKNELAMIQTIVKDETLKEVLNHPNVLKDEKKALLQKLISSHRLIVNFMMVLVDRSRIHMVDEIIEGYNELANQALGIVSGVVKSANPLNDAQRASLETMLQEKLNQRVSLTYYVEEKLLAGLRVEVQGRVFDNSALGKLERIKEKVDTMTLKIEV
ncbi:MAG: ATP synthase F1 subunit delta [Erysipelotrichaceae bacterium]